MKKNAEKVKKKVFKIQASAKIKGEERWMLACKKYKTIYLYMYSLLKKEKNKKQITPLL